MGPLIYEISLTVMLNNNSSQLSYKVRKGLHKEPLMLYP